MKLRIVLFAFVPFIFSIADNPFSTKELPYYLSFSSDKKLLPGEELNYVVSYSFIKLGEVRIRVKDKKNSMFLPFFMNEQKVHTGINFYDNIIPVSIGARNCDVQCVRLHGQMN